MSFSPSLLRYIPMILVMGIIFSLSHQSPDHLILPAFAGVDKLAHCAIYGLLALTVLFALSGPGRELSPLRMVVVTVLVCGIYGMLDEFHQSFIPGRCVSAADLLADVCGAVLVGLAWLWQGAEKKSRARSLGFD